MAELAERKGFWDEVREQLDLAFPAAWREILDRRVPFYPTLTAEEQERLEDKIQHFILTTTFSSSGGVEITDEVRVVIAATACRLTLNMPWEEYTRLRHVGVRGEASWLRDGRLVEGTGSYRKVTLSWPSFLRGLAGAEDGDNIGYHEFAHALDGADGSMDGDLHGPSGPGAATRAQVVANARAAVALAVRSKLPPPIDGYAAKSEAELLAVATEWFFERPHDLRAAMPELYDLLRGLYRQDPCG